jgi:hypothetical protein
MKAAIALNLKFYWFKRVCPIKEEFLQATRNHINGFLKAAEVFFFSQFSAAVLQQVPGGYNFWT